jgi:hypothetical protein
MSKILPRKACPFCGVPVEPLQSPGERSCTFCGTPETVAAACPGSHHCCDRCKTGEVRSAIAIMTGTTTLTDPAAVAELMMGLPQLGMLDCDHAFVAAGAFMAALKNSPYGGRITASKDNRITVKGLSRCPMVCREEGSGTRLEAEKILEGQGFSLDRGKVAAVFGSTDAVKQAVKAGMGLAVVSRLSVEEELKHKVLKEVMLAAPRMKRKFYIITHKKRALPLPYALFLDHLMSSLKTS